MWGQREFNELRSLIVCRLKLFNARRGGEAARLTIKEWTEAKDGVWMAPEQLAKIIDPIDKALL